MTGAPRNRPLLLGHRGARGIKNIPENTFAAFDRALADGCDGFEFDVRLTRDGVAVVCHDPQAGGIEIARSPAAQLGMLPKLEDVLSRYCERAFLDIELKVAGAEEMVVALLRKYPPRRLVVSSFLPEVVRAVHAASPKVPVGLICETRAELRAWDSLPVEYVIPQRKLLDSGLARELKGAGKRILVWTVNSASEMRKFADLGVDGIISDDTGLLVQTLAVKPGFES